jgi:phosphopantothenoylcysteine synthetase/decarboxylase
VTLINRDGQVEELPRMRKSEVADAVLDRAERYMSSD